MPLARCRPQATTSAAAYNYRVQHISSLSNYVQSNMTTVNSWSRRHVCLYGLSCSEAIGADCDLIIITWRCARCEFLGGAEKHCPLRSVRAGGYACGFLLYPVSTEFEGLHRAKVLFAGHEVKREASSWFVVQERAADKWSWRLLWLRTSSNAGFEMHNQAYKRPFPEQVARGIRSWPASGMNWPG